MTEPTSAPDLPEVWRIAKSPLSERAQALVMGVPALIVLVAMISIAIGYHDTEPVLAIAMWLAIALFALALTAAPIEAVRRARLVARIRAQRPLAVWLPKAPVSAELAPIAREQGATVPAGYTTPVVWLLHEAPDGVVLEGWWGDAAEPGAVIPLAGAAFEPARVRLNKGGDQNALRVTLPGREKPFDLFVGDRRDVVAPIWRLLGR